MNLKLCFFVSGHGNALQVVHPALYLFCSSYVPCSIFASTHLNNVQIQQNWFSDGKIKINKNIHFAFILLHFQIQKI